MKQIKVIGIGGIGTALLPFLCRYLNYREEEVYIVTLIDGDTFETSNKPRQSFKELGNKAEVTKEALEKDFEYVAFKHIPKYFSKDNAEMIKEGDVVFLGVDNHKTRKEVSDHCQTLDNIVLISGGNELTDGNVYVYIKKGGKEITAPMTKYHREIREPQDKNPKELSCAEKAALPSGKQVLVTNMGVAWLMFVALWLLDEKGDEGFGEFYLDIVEGAVNKIERNA